MLSGPALYVDHDDQPNAVYVKQSRTKVGIQVSYLILCIFYPVFNLKLKVIQPIALGDKITITYGVDDRGETRQR